MLRCHADIRQVFHLMEPLNVPRANQPRKNGVCTERAISSLDVSSINSEMGIYHKR